MIVSLCCPRKITPEQEESMMNLLSTLNPKRICGDSNARSILGKSLKINNKRIPLEIEDFTQINCMLAMVAYTNGTQTVWRIAKKMKKNGMPVWLIWGEGNITPW